MVTMVNPVSRVGVTIERPDGSPPSEWSGLITDVISYSVHRGINQAGQFSVAMRATAQEATQVRTGWNVSLKEERMLQNPDVYMPEWILRKGRVLNRAFNIDPSGSGILELSGETNLGRYNNTLIHKNQSFTNANLPTILSALQASVGVSVPTQTPLRTVQQNLSITFNDQTVLAILIKLAELTRTNLRELWDDDTWSFTDQDNLPAMGGIDAVGFGDLYLLQTERGDPGQAAQNGYGPVRYGIGIIQGIPTVQYDGRQIVNRLVGIGTEWDGSELTLGGASYPLCLYSPQAALGPDGQPYYYIEDAASIADHGLIEANLMRSDVKNPNDNASDRAKAKKALLAVTANELLRRRSEVESLSVQIINGAETSILPGSRVYIRYKGMARLRGGKMTWLDLDKYMLVMGRSDTSTPTGLRMVTLELAAPVRGYQVPGEVVAIPTPPASTVTDPQWPALPHDPIPFPVPPAGNNDLAPLPDMPSDYYEPDSALDALDNSLYDALSGLTYGHGGYQSCCADQTTDINDGAVGPEPSASVAARWHLPQGAGFAPAANNVTILALEDAEPAAVSDCVVTQLGSYHVYTGLIDPGEGPQERMVYWAFCVATSETEPVFSGHSVCRGSGPSNAIWLQPEDEDNNLIHIPAYRIVAELQYDLDEFPHSAGGGLHHVDLHTELPLVDQSDYGVIVEHPAWNYFGTTLEENRWGYTGAQAGQTMHYGPAPSSALTLTADCITDNTDYPYSIGSTVVFGAVRVRITPA